MKHKTRNCWVLAIIVLIVAGCGAYQKRIYYAPQSVTAWKNVGVRHYQFECNDGDVRVSPIVLSAKEWAKGYLWVPIPSGENKEMQVHNRNQPWSFIRFRRKSRIEACELSFVLLESRVSGERIAPTSVETNIYNDDHFSKQTTDCLYYFDVKQNPKASYNLTISENVLGCRVNPIPYTFEHATEYYPVLLQ